MRAVDIIAKKRDGEALSDEEIRWFIEQYSQGELPDYQASALLMAVYLRGMDDRETTTLTDAIVQSGEQLDLSMLGGKVVDKHSSGGVGDKTTLVVGPIVAATGLPVAKMSGRGLGFTGGTLDKLESIPGFTIQLSHDQFMAQVREIGLVVAGTTASLAPADGKLYALRDVTATVSSLPLIASSIMSKKLAAGADAIVLDVKVGEGAFMRTLEEARALAKAMVAIGTRMGREVTALLSDMNQPLGRAVGNALEIRESVETLHGQGPEDFEAHCLTVAAHMLLLGEKAESLDAAHELAKETLQSGAAWQKFKAMVAAQGGDLSYIEDTSRLPRAPYIEMVPAPQDGILAGIHAREVGLTVVEMGGGRATKEASIDPAVGVVLQAKVGDRLLAGEPLFELHAASEAELAKARTRLLAAHSWSSWAVKPLPLFYDTISSHPRLQG
ncbi:MAG: pyrimidine-nucleoside phosphorylase [Ardenticatenales bacterium]|nr:pyrimidine-nucleoside phosphorylase [Ardenticatenales bacterium]